MTTRASIPDRPFGFAPCLLDREVAKATCHIQETLRWSIGPLSTLTVCLSLGLWDTYKGPPLTNKVIKSPQIGAT